MDTKSAAANFAMLQTFLTAAGLLAPRTQSVGFFEKLGYYVIAIITISTIGIGFLLAGLYMYLITIMQPFEVCLIMGGVILALALGILASRIFVIYMFKRKLKNAISDLYNDAKDAIGDIAEDLKKPIQENPKFAVAMAAIVGFIIARKFFDK